MALRRAAAYGSQSGFDAVRGLPTRANAHPGILHLTRELLDLSGRRVEPARVRDVVVQAKTKWQLHTCRRQDAHPRPATAKQRRYAFVSTVRYACSRRTSRELRRLVSEIHNAWTKPPTPSSTQPEANYDAHRSSPKRSFRPELCQRECSAVMETCIMTGCAGGRVLAEQPRGEGADADRRLVLRAAPILSQPPRSSADYVVKYVVDRWTHR
jgi:hypothetical protein